jgi:hypothetical protein
MHDDAWATLSCVSHSRSSQAAMLPPAITADLRKSLGREVGPLRNLSIALSMAVASQASFRLHTTCEKATENGHQRCCQPVAGISSP